MRIRAVLAGAMALLLGLLAGACAEESSSGSLGLTPGAIAAAAVRTTAAKSARMHMVMKVSGIQEAGAPENLSFEGDGRMGLGRPLGELTMDMGDLLGLPGADTKMVMRIVDTVAYMKMPALSDDEMGLPAGKKWVKLDFGAMADEEGFDLADLQPFGMTDPAEILGFLKEVGSVRKVGTEKVRGAKSTHYTAVVDFGKVFAAADETEREELKAFLGSDGAKTMPFDVWVGTDGLLRRVQFTIDLSGIDEASPNAKMSMQMEMFDFGVSLADIVAPPASEVVDIEQMMEEDPSAVEDPSAAA